MLGEICVLLVDSEAAVMTADAVAHLRALDGWDFPQLNPHEVFLMAQAMEAWFLADRTALSLFYGKSFLLKSLPGTEKNVEEIRKDDLEPSLKHASAGCESKGQYHKVRHGFSLLARIDPSKVATGSNQASKLNAFLKSL